MRATGAFLLALHLMPGCQPAQAEFGDDAPPPSQTATIKRSTAPPLDTKGLSPASAPSAAPAAGGAAGPRCRPQPPQDFLLRQNYIVKLGVSREERKRRVEAREHAIAYRNREYGHVPGVGASVDPALRAMTHAESTTFMGRSVLVHEKIVPALRCVEEVLERECTSVPYRPEHVSGFREKNSFIDYEVSNHLYGIALDIDSNKNPCCGCIGKWKEHPACKRPGSVYDRMAMPRCWVDVFERYGFHWLGRDEMQDSMHFEFLGDPERILE